MTARITLTIASAAFVFHVTAFSASAQTGLSYLDPAGGWLYTYNGNFNGSVDGPGMPQGFGTGSAMALDGTYEHGQGDKWDGTAPGDPLSNVNDPIGPASTPTGGPAGTSPGGAGIFSDGGRDYIRIQDAGNPEDHGWTQGSDPQNTNRRVYFGHDMAQDGVTGANQMFLDNGFTMSFRMRIPNSGPLDDIYTLDENDSPVVLDWLPAEDPDRLRGLPIHNNGRGMITIVQNQQFDTFGDLVNKDFPIAFSLISEADIDDINDFAAQQGGTTIFSSHAGSGGLVMNNLNGNSPTGAIDFESPGTLNLLEIAEDELDDWHEFWITIEDNGGTSGTHRVRIYMDGQVDGSGVPLFTEFNVTASTSNNSSYANSESAYLEFGVNDTGFFGAFDMDFISYKLGVHAPVAAVLFDEADFDEDGDVDGDDFLAWQGGFGISSGAMKSDGDADGDGDVDGDDFLTWQSQFGNAGGDGAHGAVPEPASGVLLLCAAGILAWWRRRRRAA